MSEMKIVDGNLMVQAISVLKHPIEIDPDGVEGLKQAIKAKKIQVSRYRNARFMAMADKTEREISAVKREISRLENEEVLKEWREMGFFVIREPEWEHKLDHNHNHLDFDIPYNIVSTKRAFANHQDYQALYKVPIHNWVGDVPIQVLEAVEEFGNKFRDLSIMFVARSSKIYDLVANFVRQDPILVGAVGTDNLVVLKMWGDDLEELSLSLLEPQTLEAHK